MLTRTCLALGVALVLGLPAVAQEVPVLASTAAPPADDAVTTIETPAQQAARVNAEWARRILAREASAEADEPGQGKQGCVRNPDRAPHGVVWGEVGSGGYKSGGVIASQPVGDCGSLTVGYEQTHDNRGGGIHRRR